MRILVQSGQKFYAVAVALAACVSVALAETPAVRQGDDGRLIYAQDDRGNRVPDFSNCGYAGADRDIPDVPTVVCVAPAAGDDGARIQAAVDRVAALPVGEGGFRGAVELERGKFEVAGQLKITASGIILRGSGAGEGCTTIVATGPDRRALFRICGSAKREFIGWQTRIVEGYVPVGATSMKLNSASGLTVGDTITITRPSTAHWIEAIGANAFGVGWRPGSRNVVWERVITAIEGDTITLDAPITTAIDPTNEELKEGNVQRCDIQGRVENVGIEDVRLVSQPATDNPLDEDHAWHGVSIENAQNAWVRRVEFTGFAGGAVSLCETTKWVTVEDCISCAPVSQLGGYRRHTFFTQGQQALFLRCWSEHGRHDFAVGHCAAGPNAFVNCRTSKSLGDSGPLESWASGVLYDNVRIDGAGLNLVNRWIDPPGTGWSAANCVLWQCRAATIACFRPPTANNWAIGCWAGFSGDGTFEARSDFVRPMSLYQSQLRERLGDDAAARVDPILGKPVTATNPTVGEAAAFTAQSNKPAMELIEVIRERIAEHTKSGGDWGLGTTGSTVDPVPSPQPPAPSPQPLHLKNGWLVAGDRIITGGRWRQGIWRGNIRPDEWNQFGPALTRFVPGRVGAGFTDDLGELASRMVESGTAVFDYNYSLWLDRRRDDHTMGRQANGNVAPPFLEQPFARTGPESGAAWDGLSKYDLTRFNLWYWNRLREFAGECDERGLVLLHQNYLQHNILEAGAHWVDSPWRPANNVNDSGLPEPPPFVGDKRIFMAANFYDVSNAKLRELHRGYIRQCLDNFAANSNVIQLTSAEYSGPLAFTEFWLDTIVEWQRDTGRDAIVALSAPKDVQDAILADPPRAPHVDVIDIRYWAYTADGGLYAPHGGQNLAPRQHLRQARQKPGGPAAIVKAVREYRDRFPEKAVIYSAEENCPSIRDGWAVLIAGGSLPNIQLPDELAKLVPTMHPLDGIVTDANQWCLADGDGNYLIRTTSEDSSLKIELPHENNSYTVRWLERDGRIAAEETRRARGPIELPSRTGLVWLVFDEP